MKVAHLIQVGCIPLEGFKEELHYLVRLKTIILDTWLNSYHNLCTTYNLLMTTSSQS